VGLKEMPQRGAELLPAVEPSPEEVVEEDAADA
jgi:hypothetical protein